MFMQKSVLWGCIYQPFFILAICLRTAAQSPACTPPPAGLVGWWAGENNAVDNVGGNNGTLINGASFTTGEVGNAFEFDGNSFVLINPSAPGNLDIGEGSGLTIECWINPTTISSTVGMLTTFENQLGAWDGYNAGVQIIVNGIPNHGPFPGCLGVNVVDTVGGSHTFGTAPNVLTAGVWQHVALTYDRTTGLGTFYTNGVTAAQANLGVFTPQTSFTNFLIGGHTTYASVANPADCFVGGIDELSLYSRALAPNEIAAIAAAGSAGKCYTPTPPTITAQPAGQSVAVGSTALLQVSVSGTSPLQFQWSCNGTNLAGATNALLALANVQPSQAGNYSVLVTNLYGSTNSAAAALTVYGVAPFITAQPSDRAVYVGSSAAFAVAASGTLPLSYQWNVNGTNIPGATSAILTLSNIQASQSGNYSVLVTNLYGSTNSALAALNVSGLPPFLYEQPSSVTAVEGGSASFTAVVTGTLPLTYQWSFGGTPLAGATNATLTLTNVQFSQAGSYAAQIANAYGSTNTIAATLTVIVAPKCAPVPGGLVGWWAAEDNGVDTVANNNATLENGTSFTSGEVGTAFSFNGNNNFIIANPSAPGNLDVGTSSGLTIECWIKPNQITSAAQIFITYERALGQDNGYSTGVTFLMDNIPNHGVYPGCLGVNVVDTANESHTFGTAANTLVAGVWQHVALTYDKTSGMAYMYTNGAVAAQANLGIFTPQTTYTNLCIGGQTTYASLANPANPYGGAMDELSLYNRALSAKEIAGIFAAGSGGKCPAGPTITGQPVSLTNLVGTTASFSVSASGIGQITYQWSLDGNEIAAATNATLTLTDVQLSEAGDYTVSVNDEGGGTNSVVATLTVVTPPTITEQPQSLTVGSFGATSFSVAANGTGPLSFQWQKNGTNLVDDGNVVGSTTTNLTIGSVTIADDGDYEVVVSNPYASTNSSPALLTVPETVISIGSASAISGTTITVPVIINALGTESGFIGSVAFDPTKLTLNSVQGAAANVTQAASGFVGFAAFPTTSATYGAGSNTVAELVFTSLPVTNDVVASLTFGDTPVNRQLTDFNFDNLPAIYEGGVVQLTPAEYCGDVWPRFGGNHLVNLQDWEEVGRMVAGLDVPTNSDELLRADCAPRGAPDGVLTVADWVQAGRYTLGLDPLTLVTPPIASSGVVKVKPMGGQAPSRILQVGTVAAQRGQTVSVPVSLVCVTNENAVGLTLTYNPSQLRLLSFSLGTAMSAGRYNINSNQLGKVGLTLAVSPGNRFPIGTNQMAVLKFAASTSASGTAAITLDGSVAALQTADILANPVGTAYQNGAVTLPPQPNLTGTVSGGKLQFGWALASGTFQVQTASQPGGPWTTIVLPLTTNGASVNSVLSYTNHQQYFRLLGQ